MTVTNQPTATCIAGKDYPGVDVRGIIQRGDVDHNGRPYLLARRLVASEDRFTSGYWELPGCPVPFGSHETDVLVIHVRDAHGFRLDTRFSLSWLRPVQELMAQGADATPVSHWFYHPVVIRRVDPRQATNQRPDLYSELDWLTDWELLRRDVTWATRSILQRYGELHLSGSI